jgi:hypothetical protein
MLAFGALLASGALTRKQAPTSAPGTSPAADPGLSEQDVTAQLSKILPAFVDKLTPQGRVPTNDEITRFGA